MPCIQFPHIARLLLIALLLAAPRTLSAESEGLPSVPPGHAPQQTEDSPYGYFVGTQTETDSESETPTFESQSFESESPDFPPTDLETRIQNLESLNSELYRRLDSVERSAQSGSSGKSSSSSDSNSLKAKWHNGAEFESENKEFRVHVGGRTQFDSSWFQTDPEFQNDPAIGNRVNDGVGFRRARLRVDGTMYDVIEWAAEYDFVNSANLSGGGAPGSPTAVTAPTDLWFAFTELPWIGNIKVGNHKEPIGFEHLVSSRFLPFMERSFNQDAFYGAFNNGFSPGISIYDTYADELGTWAIGLYKPTTNVFAADIIPGDASVTGRLTHLLWYREEGAGLMHVGVSARHATLANNFTRYRVRGPERAGLSSSLPLFADTTTFKGESQDTVNFEAVTNMGCLTIQSEYLLNYVQDGRTTVGVPLGTVFYHGGYVEALYFLTGEYRDYNRKNAAFDRVKPLENAFFIRSDCGQCNGWGAWQVGFRYNYLDLNDQGFNGGKLNDYTWGLNWFLNPNMKVQWNYSLTHRQSPTADIYDGWNQGFGMRLAHDF
ncbi:MAG: hypothetical protein KDA68_18635 [Planctomycetaceae bacterium]|nr:hypothetical protein [Planctomycetaceae bacterium]